MPELLWLLLLGFALGACGPAIGPGGGRGIMLPMSQPDPGASA
jgi:hypothetical protein